MVCLKVLLVDPEFEVSWCIFIVENSIMSNIGFYILIGRVGWFLWNNREKILPFLNRAKEAVTDPNSTSRLEAARLFYRTLCPKKDKEKRRIIAEEIAPDLLLEYLDKNEQ